MRVGVRGCWPEAGGAIPELPLVTDDRSIGIERLGGIELARSPGARGRECGRRLPGEGVEPCRVAAVSAERKQSATVSLNDVSVGRCSSTGRVIPITRANTLLGLFPHERESSGHQATTTRAVAAIPGATATIEPSVLNTLTALQGCKGNVPADRREDG